MSYFSESAKKSSIQPNLIAPSPCNLLSKEVRYNPVKLNKPTCAQTPFGSTVKLDRSLTTSTKQDKQSGLQIQPALPHESVLNQLYKLSDRQQQKSSVFASKTSRFHTTKQKAPGPGDYNLLSERKKSYSVSKLNQLVKKNNVSMSTSRIKAPSIPSDHLGYREDENNVMKKVTPPEHLQPHPGSYDIGTNLSTSRGLKWKSLSQKAQKPILMSPGPGAYQPNSNTNIKAPISSFVSSSDRFDDKKGLKPGPGSYNVLPLNKKSHSNNRQGNFNSMTSRFGGSNTSVNVGPGQYFNSVKERVKTKSVDTLRSKLHLKQNTKELIQKKTIFDQKNQNPGPGQYANPQGITFKLQKQLFRKFNDTTLPKQRRAVFQISESLITPGPGTYTQRKEGEKDNLRKQDQVNKQKQKKLWARKKSPRKTEVVNLKDYEGEVTPSPFDYGNFSNTIQDKIIHYQNRMTLTEAKPFGAGEKRFKHYEEGKMPSYANQQAQQQEKTQKSFKELGYYEDNKKIKKLVMTNLKVKVPFGSSTTKMKEVAISQSPAKFYRQEEPWIKKSHNIRSKLN